MCTPGLQRTFMTGSAILAFLHFVAVFGIFSTVVFEWLVVSRTPTYAEARQIQLCDRWFGVFSALVLGVGFLRVLYFEKGTAFYFANPFFRAKLALFLVVGLLSIYPTIRFIKWGAQTKQGRAPSVPAAEFSRIRAVLRTELVLLLGAALCASLMARGIGS
jgi:putative membrane protein